MALRFMDSCGDHCDDANVKWNVGSYPVGVGLGRNGTNCYRPTSQLHSGTITFAPHATWIVGFAIYWENTISGASVQFVRLYDIGVVQFSLRQNADGTISLYRGDGTALLGTTVLALGVNTWYYIELKVTIDNAGTYELRVNGVTWLSGSGDTQQTANPYANNVLITGIATITYRLDDIYIEDGVDGTTLTAPFAQTDKFDDFLGDVRVEALLPNGDGANLGWTPSAGTRFSCVDENPPNEDVDYISTSTTPDIYTATLTDLVSVTGSIIAVQTLVYGRKTDAGGALLKPVLRSNGVDTLGSDDSPGTSYRYWARQIFGKDNSDGNAWSIARVNALEAGVQRSG